DVFGIAAVAYELLANEAPYEGLPRGHARKRGLRLRRAKGIPRYRWKALSRALQLRPVERTQTVSQFVAEFGISGTESLPTVAAGGQSKQRRSLLPAGLLAVIASAAALIQFDVLNPSDILSQLRERTNVSAPPVVTSGSVAEEAAASSSVDSVADDVDGNQMIEIQSQQLPAPPPEIPATEVDVADDLLTGPVLSAEENTKPENFAPVEEAQQAQETATTVTESAPEVTESLEFVADSPIDAALPVPPTVSFAREAVMVREGQDMASVVLQRLGNTEAETPVFWWTGDNTAIADLDYADLGVRSETFETGVESISLYVPLISDSLAEQRESFYVFVASDLEPGTVSDRIEVIVNDDDR
ncbi:MAG: Calx-beta domain-containing protein, partial [Woeseiaceae bacterium]